MSPFTYFTNYSLKFQLWTKSNINRNFNDMAELNVQPKKTSPFIWILLAIIAIGLLLFLTRGCNKNETNNTTGKDTVAKTVTNWKQVDFNSPAASYEEITDKQINVRGNGHYAIYGLGENILFAKDQSTIQPGADARLKQIAASLKKRFGNASIAIYGNTDATGTAAHNQKLGAERAKSVRSWLVGSGIDEDRITVQSKGEADPVASNATAKGKQLNRSVEIVALDDDK